MVDVQKFAAELSRYADFMFAQSKTTSGLDSTTRLAILSAHYTISAISSALKVASDK